MDDVCMPINKSDASKNKAKGLIIKHMIRSDLPKDQGQGRDGFYMNLFNIILLNFDKMDLK